jgi:hypothetical protein
MFIPAERRYLSSEGYFMMSMAHTPREHGSEALDIVNMPPLPKQKVRSFM